MPSGPVRVRAMLLTNAKYMLYGNAINHSLHVKDFIKFLIVDNALTDFEPNKSFRMYRTAGGRPRFKKAECKELELHLDRCFGCCLPGHDLVQVIAEVRAEHKVKA